MSTATHGWLLYDLDTRRQGQLVRQPASNPLWRSELTKQARLALAFGERLILTDTQVFDGPALLLIGPDGLREMCGFPDRSAIHIAMRNESAKTSLDGILDNAEFRSELPQALSFLSDDQIHRLRMMWVDAIERGDFSRGPYPEIRGSFPTILETLLSIGRPEIVGLEELTDQLGRTVARSTALRLIEAHPESIERTELERWWESAYMDALATQHGAWWLGTDDSGINTRLPHSGAVISEHGSVTAWFATSLGELSPSAFHELYRDVVLPAAAKSRFTPGLQGWQRVRSRIRGYVHTHRLNRIRLHLAVVSATAPATPILNSILTVGRVLAWFALGAWALSEEVRGEVQGGAAIIAVAVATLIQVPWSDLLELGRSSSTARYAIQHAPHQGASR